MTEAEQAVLALVCGYADWERWQLAMLVAHVDESGRGDPAIFVVGCLTALPGQWTTFTREWKATLPPGVSHFKYSTAVRQPWFEATMPKLLDVINRNVKRGDLLAVRVPVYRQLFYKKVSATYDSPFHQGYVSIVAQCLAELSKAPSRAGGKVDFIFDEIDDTEFLELISSWKRLKKRPPNKDVKRLMGSEPSRKDDTIVVPLQGADLVAGLMYRACHQRGSAPAHIDGLKINHRAMAWDEKTLPGLFNGINRAQLEYGILYEDGKRRSKRLGRARELLRASGE